MSVRKLLLASHLCWLLSSSFAPWVTVEVVPGLVGVSWLLWLFLGRPLGGLAVHPGFTGFPHCRSCPAVFAAFSKLRSARQVESFVACSFRHLPKVVFHPGGYLRSFCCSSQLQIQEAAERRGLHGLRRAVEPRDPQQTSSPEGRWKRGNRDSLVCGRTWGPPAVGACRPLGLGCGRRRAPPRDSDAHHPHARKGSVSPHAPQHTH